MRRFTNVASLQTGRRFFFLLHSFQGRRVGLTLELSHLSTQTLSLFSRELSPEGKPFQLLWGISELPASLLLCFGVIMKQKKGDSNTSPTVLRQQVWQPRPLPGRSQARGLQHGTLGKWTERDGDSRDFTTTQSSVQFKPYESLISRISHVIVSD